MPFVPRCVEPRYLSRTSLRDADGRPRVRDEELQAVTNCTLAGALKQLASLVLLADDVFNELAVRLAEVAQRSQALKTRVAKLEEEVDKYDPKTVPVPEDSLSNFAVRKVHYTAKNPLEKELFTPATRPRCVLTLYEKATSRPLPAGVLAQLRLDSERLTHLQITPVLGARRRRLRVDADIDTHIPIAVEELRKWTSKEAIGDITALPDASSRITSGVTLTPEELSDCGSGDDEPIDHQLPSPEEQLQVIISKFAPEIIPIDTSGKFFDRMCTSRKSLHLETNGETDTVKRRTRSRKPRGKRRNTISGTDQKELREAIAGETSSAVDTQEADDKNVVVRSHSSDLLKKSPIDLLSKKSGHFNSLKQWGKTRFRMMSRSPSASRDSFRDSIRSDKSRESKSPTIEDSPPSDNITMRKKRGLEPEKRPTHKRCASYSSDDKSTGIPATLPTTATINCGVKLRGYSAQRRLRRSGLGKDEMHSSSGNWSASSESGRTSIGSEITTTTVPPKSTTSAATSSNSLNTHMHGPPSSIISRRRFLNTSGSSSVTSEGTMTPDMIHDPHDDMETSSEYSCDTEGYYTSFHMDSGLKTLKEEDSPSTPLHTSNALSSLSIVQNTTAENEYELFGKGSTSTTTSSAGTVCTTLMAAGSDRSLIISPTVPERKSSLTKLNRSKGNIHSANASLDRNFSSNSPDCFNSLRYPKGRDQVEKQRLNFSLPSTNEFSEAMITITNNVGQPRETVLAMVHQEQDVDSAKKSTGTSSPDSGHNTSSSPIEDSVSSALGKHSLSEQDYSESSDLEGTDRIERIRYKTTINSSRIPSLCVITPSNSDDECESIPREPEEKKPPTVIEMHPKVQRPKLELPSDAPADRRSTDLTKDTYEPAKPVQSKHTNIKNSLLPLNNLMCKLKGVLPQKLSTKKSPSLKEPEISESLYDSGDYVTIADVRNNNKKANVHPKGIYSRNDIVKKNLQSVLSGKLHEEYVSLNELPNCLNESKDFLEDEPESKQTSTHKGIRQFGAKVTLDSQGKVIYSSDSIRRRKGAHTTFEPGPFVKEVKATHDIPGYSSDVVSTDSDELDSSKKIPVPTSPQLGKIIIKAPSNPNGPVTTEMVSLPTPKPSTIITAATIPSLHIDRFTHEVGNNTPILESRSLTDENHKSGAYVNIHDAEGVSLSPTRDNITDYRRLHADPPRTDMSSRPVYNLQVRRSNQAVPSNTITRHLPSGYGSPPQQTFHRDNSTYWTLRPQKSTPIGSVNVGVPQYHTLQRHQNIPPQNQYTQMYPVRNPRDDYITMSPVEKRANAPFQSSTPSKDSVDSSTRTLSPVKSSMSNEELYAVIHKSKKKLNIQQDRCESPALSSISLSPVSSESSLTTRAPMKPESGYLVDPRTRNSSTLPNMRSKSGVTTCADRMGPAPQTSRLDFKRLLLQHGVKLNPNPQQTHKLSAVEQLRLNRAKLQPSQNPNVSQLNILDLSGSPKTYSHRKVIRAAPQNSSPSRTNTLIKEHKSTPKILLSPKSQWRFSSPRSDVLSSPIPEANNEDDTSNSSGEKHESPTSKTVPIITHQHFGARRNLIPIDENIQETDCDFVELRTNAKPADSREMKAELSRAEMLQARRAEFFNSSPERSPPRLMSFKAPFPSNTESPKRTPSPPALETAL